MSVLSSFIDSGQIERRVRPADRTVVTDARAHHCPICGRGVEMVQSFRCTECGREDFCTNCVTSLPSLGTLRFVCRACMSQKGWACTTCGNLAVATCIICKRRACGQHNVATFGIAERRGVRIGFLTCPSCNGQLCVGCVETKSGVFSTRYYCRKCRNELIWTPQQIGACKFCYHIVTPGAVFCTFCGKSQL